jgi:hypothetical protein
MYPTPDPAACKPCNLSYLRLPQCARACANICICCARARACACVRERACVRARAYVRARARAIICVRVRTTMCLSACCSAATVLIYNGTCTLFVVAKLRARTWANSWLTFTDFPPWPRRRPPRGIDLFQERARCRKAPRRHVSGASRSGSLLLLSLRVSAETAAGTPNPDDDTTRTSQSTHCARATPVHVHSPTPALPFLMQVHHEPDIDATSEVLSIAWSPDGTVIASASADRVSAPA